MSSTKQKVQKLINDSINLLNLKHIDGAKSILHQALVLDNSNDNALHLMAIVTKQKNEIDEAIHFANEAIKNYGWCADYYNTLAGLLLIKQQFPEALSNIERCISLNNNHAGAFNNMGMILMELGRHPEAINAYEQSIELNPNEPYVHFNYAVALLMTENWAKGWVEYDWRYAGNNSMLKYRPFHYANTSGNSILVFHEQGYGDSIHFVRYVIELAKYAKNTIVCCPIELHRLFTASGINVSDNINHKCDFFMPMMSLPILWTDTSKRIPDFYPYIKLPEDDFSNIYNKMQEGLFKVGVVWGSRRPQENDYEITNSTDSQFRLLPTSRSLVHFSSMKRSFNPSILENIAYHPGIQLYSLQKGPDANQLHECNFPITDIGECFQDFADTAAAINKLDLVIAIDTSVAHLAGAMGKPVWLLLPFSSEWRWGWNKQTTPWYPSMRIFKQQKLGDWQGVFEEIGKAIKEEFPCPVTCCC